MYRACHWNVMSKTWQLSGTRDCGTVLRAEWSQEIGAMHGNALWHVVFRFVHKIDQRKWNI